MFSFPTKEQAGKKTHEELLDLSHSPGQSRLLSLFLVFGDNELKCSTCYDCDKRRIQKPVTRRELVERDGRTENVIDCRKVSHDAYDVHSVL